MESSIVGAKGQVVIPKKIRAAFHIKTGTRVHFETRHGEIVLTLRLAPRPSLDFARDRLAVRSLRIPPHPSARGLGICAERSPSECEGRALSKVPRALPVGLHTPDEGSQNSDFAAHGTLPPAPDGASQ